MFYMCPCCGKVIEKDYEGDYFCGSCREQMQEAVQCEECHEFFLVDDDQVNHGICLGCLEEHATLDAVIEYGDQDKQKIEINGFLQWYLGKDLEAVLFDYLRNDPAISEELAKAVTEFCMQDEYNFAEFIKEKE